MNHQLNANVAPEKLKVPRWLAVITLLWVAAVVTVLAIQLIGGSTFLVGGYTVYDFIADGGTLLLAMYIFFVLKRYKLYAGLAALVVVTAVVFALAEVPNNHSAWHSRPFGFSDGSTAIVAVVQQEQNAVTVYPRKNALFVDNAPLTSVPLPEGFAYLDVTFEGGAALVLYDAAENVLSTNSIPLA